MLLLQDVTAVRLARRSLQLQANRPSVCSHRQIQLSGHVELLHEHLHLVVSVLLSGGTPRREVQTNLGTRGSRYTHGLQETVM